MQVYGPNDCVNGKITTDINLPRTTERHVRERGDEPRSNSVVRKRCIPYPARLERGECSELPARVVPQRHGRKSVIRGLPKLNSVTLARKNLVLGLFGRRVGCLVYGF